MAILDIKGKPVSYQNDDYCINNMSVMISNLIMFRHSKIDDNILKQVFLATLQSLMTIGAAHRWLEFDHSTGQYTPQ